MRIGANAAVVETARCGALDKCFEFVFFKHIFACFDVGKTLRKRTAVALDTAHAPRILPDGYDAGKTFAFEIVFAI